MLHGTLVCPRCQNYSNTLLLNYFANHERFYSAPGYWYVNCLACREEHKGREPDFSVPSAEFITVAAVTELNDHLSRKLWYTESVQTRMREAVRRVLSPDERKSLDRQPWPFPSGRDAAIEMYSRFREEREASGERARFRPYTMDEIRAERDEVRGRIAGIETSSYVQHARNLDRLWSAAPAWLKAQLQKVDDRGIEAILRMYNSENDRI